MKKKLIYISLFVIFTFLTGGIKYSYKKIDIYKNWRIYKEEIRGFGFFREKVIYEHGENTLTLEEIIEEVRSEDRKANYGWGLHPSLKIFSISKE